MMIDAYQVDIPFFVVASSQEMAERKLINALSHILRFPYGTVATAEEPAVDSPISIASLWDYPEHLQEIER